MSNAAPRAVARRSTTYIPHRPQVCSRASKDQYAPSRSRQYSQTAPQQFQASCPRGTRLRRNMYAWLNGPGAAFRDPLPSSTNYLSAYDRQGKLLRAPRFNLQKSKEKQQSGLEPDPKDREAEDENEENAVESKQAEKPETLPRERSNDLRPYPLNQSFRSQSVLSEPLREQIYTRVVDQGHSITMVSTDLGVDMRRVAAVVRLKTIEKDWVKQGKKLATPYASAVLDMLPQTKFSTLKPVTHESINDLPVHPATRQQIFYPASESRQFTRADAAKVFSPELLPADDRIPHPEMIQLERDNPAGVTREARHAAINRRDEAERAKKAEQERKRQAWEAKNVRVVPGQRWDFKFQNVSVDDAGADGRGRRGVGWRYGAPHEDRKRGLIKIPTSVA